MTTDCVSTAIIHDTLQFNPMRLADAPSVRRMLQIHLPQWRTCDFTVGGLLMWIDYFRYEIAIWRDTMFVRGLNESDLSTAAYSVPVGALPMRQALEMLRRHCDGSQCVLSAVPEEAVEQICRAVPVVSIEPLVPWTDYLYRIDALASLQGKKLSKKRNHVNRFEADNPDYNFAAIDDDNIAAVIEFYKRQRLAPGKSVSADYERLQVLDVLRHREIFGFEGAVLSVPSKGVVAFTMGEVLGDTLYVHIEKMDHEVAGAGEAVNCYFARMIQQRYGDRVVYVNREDDAGDEGLRRAKLSYHPDRLLNKYNVLLR